MATILGTRHGRPAQFTPFARKTALAGKAAFASGVLLVGLIAPAHAADAQPSAQPSSANLVDGKAVEPRVGAPPPQLSNEEAAPDITPTPAKEGDLKAEDVRALKEEISSLRSELAHRPVTPSVPKKVDETEERDEAFLASGSYYVGGTLGVNYLGRDNVDTLFGTMEDGSRVSMNVAGMFGRVLEERNLAVGMVVNYNYTRDTGILSSDSDPPNDKRFAEYKISAGPTVRTFLPIIGDKVVVFSQASLTVGYGEQTERTFQEDESSVVMGQGVDVGLNVQPGVMVRANDHLAVEVGINLLGLNYSYYKTLTDYETKGTKHDANLNLDINLLSMQFAVVGYF